MKKYQARAGAPFTNEKAQVYGTELEKLTKKNNGKLTPEDVVREAERNTSVMHSFFEWTDTKAARQWRLQQARNMINHIVEVVVIEGKPSPQRSFHSITQGPTQKMYVTLKTAVNTPDYRVQLFNKAIVTTENLAQLLRMLAGTVK